MRPPLYPHTCIDGRLVRCTGDLTAGAKATHDQILDWLNLQACTILPP